MSKFAPIVAWMLVVCLAVSPLSAQQAASAAIAHPSGGVSINGSPVTGTTSVFGADRVETGPDGSVMLTASGVNLALGPNGSVSMSHGRIDLGCGSFAVLDANVPVQIGPYTVTPTAGRMRLELAQGSRLVITSRGAPASVTGPESQTIATGAAFEGTGLASCGKVPGNTLTAAAAEPAAKKNRALLWILLGGAGAGAALALASGGGSDDQPRPVSPSRP